MTKEEYINEKKRLEREHDQALRDLAMRFATENNPHKIGDIITDHIGSGRITGWSLYSWLGSPSLVYHCHNLTKKGEINKKEPLRDIYQSNIRHA